MKYTDEHDARKANIEDAMNRDAEARAMPSVVGRVELTHELLTDLAAWRAYLRVLINRISLRGTYYDGDAFKAFAIADDQLALSLNKAIGEPVAEWLKDYKRPTGGKM